MKYLILSLFLLICSLISPPIIVYAAPTATPDTLSSGEVGYTISGSTTGTVCVSMAGFKYWAIDTDISGTIQYDLENSHTNNTSCTASNYCDDISSSPSTVDLTTDSSFSVLRNHPYFCLTVDICTSCTYSTKIRGSK